VSSKKTQQKVLPRPQERREIPRYARNDGEFDRRTRRGKNEGEDPPLETKGGVPGYEIETRRRDHADMGRSMLRPYKGEWRQDASSCGAGEALFVPQGDDGVEVAGAAGGNIGGEQRDTSEENGYTEQREGIGGRNSEEQGSQQSR